MVKNKLCAIVNLTENEDQLKPLTHLRPIAALPFAVSPMQKLIHVLYLFQSLDVRYMTIFVQVILGILTRKLPVEFLPFLNKIGNYVVYARMVGMISMIIIAFL